MSRDFPMIITQKFELKHKIIFFLKEFMIKKWWQSFMPHHNSVLSWTSKKFILWKIAIIISIVRTQKNYRERSKHQHKTRKVGKSLKQQQENVFRRTQKNVRRKSFSSHHAHTICGFSQLNSSPIHSRILLLKD